MIDTTKLEASYHEYLRSKHDPKVVETLCRDLESVGLIDEATALRVFLNSEGGATYTWQHGVWAGKQCLVGSYVWKEAAFGTLWFDTVELTPMILVPNREGVSKDTIAWIAVHPVYFWQFRVFLRLLKWNLYQAYLMDVEDLFEPIRFAEIDGMSFVKNVYHEEACTYCIWFGKSLSDQAEFENAKAYLTETQFERLLPKDTLLWNGSEFPASESVRITFDVQTVGKTLQEQWEEFREHLAGNPPSNPSLYDEWERNDKIGFSTMELTKWADKPVQRPPIEGYEFVRLLNTARHLNP